MAKWRGEEDGILSEEDQHRAFSRIDAHTLLLLLFLMVCP